jgi:hypothetical protein
VAAVESILALSQRLQRHAKRGGGSELAVDLRLAAVHLRRYAAVLICEEAEAERDPARRKSLLSEALSTWRDARRHG